MISVLQIWEKYRSSARRSPEVPAPRVGSAQTLEKTFSPCLKELTGDLLLNLEGVRKDAVGPLKPRALGRAFPYTGAVLRLPGGGFLSFQLLFVIDGDDLLQQAQCSSAFSSEQPLPLPHHPSLPLGSLKRDWRINFLPSC